MSVLFAANEMEAYTASSANVIEDNGYGAGYDTAATRCGIRVGNGTPSDYAESPVYTSATTSWTHWQWYQPSSSGSNGTTMLTLYNSVGTAVFRLQMTGTFILQAQYWNGSAWTNIGSTNTLLTSTQYAFDLKVICGASGSFELWRNGAIVLFGSASMGSVTNIARHRLQCTGTSFSPYFSEVICADESTVGWKFYTKPPTGNGANTAFTGTFADVDELALSDADFLESTVANDIETLTHGTLTLGAGSVKAVVVSARASNVATGPQNLQLALRRGSTDYFTANVAGLGTSFNPFLGIWPTDPSTAAAWTSANAAAIANEFGVKSIT